MSVKGVHHYFYRFYGVMDSCRLCNLYQLGFHSNGPLAPLAMGQGGIEVFEVQSRSDNLNVILFLVNKAFLSVSNCKFIVKSL